MSDDQFERGFEEGRRQFLWALAEFLAYDMDEGELSFFTTELESFCENRRLKEKKERS